MLPRNPLHPWGLIFDGSGVMVAIMDRDIDRKNTALRNDDGTTRIKDILDCGDNTEANATGNGRHGPRPSRIDGAQLSADALPKDRACPRGGGLPRRKLREVVKDCPACGLSSPRSTPGKPRHPR